MNSREVIKKLEQAGFVQVSKRGSHLKLRHSNGCVVIVPHPKKDLPVGTVGNIAKQAGIELL